MWLLYLLAGVLLIGELLVAFIYVYVLVRRKLDKPGNIKKAAELPEGAAFDAESKSAKTACGYIDSVVMLYEAPEGTKTKYRISGSLDARITKTKETLAGYGIVRKLRFVDVKAELSEKGEPFKKRNHGGKEWRSCTMNAAMVELYESAADGRILLDSYYPSVSVNYSLSRRIMAKDSAKAAQKDKWGRKISDTDTFYENIMTETCPSCGAKLPENLKDVTCPYCQSTIFSDYYDRQVESIDIAPNRLKIMGLIGWIIYGIGWLKGYSPVKFRKKSDIVRFYDNDFRQDVYESLSESENSSDLIDMRLGVIYVRSAQNTETDTILDISVPVDKIVAANNSGTLTVRRISETVRAKFIRTRYPNRFRKGDAVISSEKSCPSCGAPFVPDENGNCQYCGRHLYRDNVKWKRME